MRSEADALAALRRIVPAHETRRIERRAEAARQQLGERWLGAERVPRQQPAGYWQ